MSSDSHQISNNLYDSEKLSIIEQADTNDFLVK